MHRQVNLRGGVRSRCINVGINEFNVVWWAEPLRLLISWGVHQLSEWLKRMWQVNMKCEEDIEVFIDHEVYQ